MIDKLIEEKQDRIDKARHHYLYESDADAPYPKEVIEEDMKNPNTIESKKAFREAILNHLPIEEMLEEIDLLVYPKMTKIQIRKVLENYLSTKQDPKQGTTQK